MLDSLFIGPHGENKEFLQDIWQELLQRTLMYRRDTFAEDGLLRIEGPGNKRYQTVKDGIDQFFEILNKEVPTFSNRYLGHMVSDVSIPALIGNIAVLFCNPNLASKETAEAGVFFETRAINALAEMIGFETPTVRGHFTSGGTMANFEALWRARYRMDHWLSMSAYLLEKGHSRENIFELAHQGWESFYNNKARHSIDMTDLRDRSYVIRGPWDIANYYRDTLKMDFPQPVILVPRNKHYSWPKSANVFGISEQAIWPTDLDSFGRLCVKSLEANIERAKQLGRPIMMNVSVTGTTELGSVDPVHEVNAILRRYRDEEGIHIWHHIDAAYGGYFCSTFRHGESELDERTAKAFAAMSEVDSVTLDPHKLGYVPYACGAFLVRDARSYSVSHISAPYLQEEVDIEYPTWSTTLEGSRSATGPGAVWLSSQVLPLDATGHGELLNQSLATKKRFEEKLAGHFSGIHTMPASDTNIISFVLAQPGETLSMVNALTAYLVECFVESPNFAITRTSMALENYQQMVTAVVESWDGSMDDDHLLVIRMVVMGPYLSDTEANEQLMDNFIEELNRFYASYPA